MTPNPSIRLGSVIQTLEHVVFPAVDGGNSLAQEQCGVVLAQLRMLLGHLPLIGGYHALCRDGIVAAVAALPEAEGGPRTREASAMLDAAVSAASALADPASAYHAVGFRLEALQRAAAADGEPGYRKALDRAVFAFARAQVQRERAWFRDAGFDPDAVSLPAVQTMIADGQAGVHES